MDFENITRIALTGGSASGKSSVLRRLKERPSAPDVNVLFMDETATAFFRERPPKIAELDSSILLRQFYILRAQLFAEDMLLTNADHVKPTVLITDRGALDVFAFLDGDEIASLGEETLTSLWSRYDHVIHLKGNYDNFLNDSETPRIETGENALRLAAVKSLEAWSRCSSFCTVEQQESIENKVSLVVDEIHRFIGRAIFL